MNNNQRSTDFDSKQTQLLKNRLQQVLSLQPLDNQRDLISAVAAELDTDILQCAAALLYLAQNPDGGTTIPETSKPAFPTAIKMVRYRLDLGHQHQLTLEQLKKILVEESGVDKNNINNVAIRGLYTLLDLPDAMPADIFQHLKSVEINQRKLDIKRVKIRKKRGNMNHRRHKPPHQKTAQAGTPKQ